MYQSGVGEYFWCISEVLHPGFIDYSSWAWLNVYVIETFKLGFETLNDGWAAIASLQSYCES